MQGSCVLFITALILVAGANRVLAVPDQALPKQPADPSVPASPSGPACRMVQPVEEYVCRYEGPAAGSVTKLGGESLPLFTDLGTDWGRMGPGQGQISMKSN